MINNKQNFLDPIILPKIPKGEYCYTITNVKLGKYNKKGKYPKCKTLRVTLSVTSVYDSVDKEYNNTYTMLHIIYLCSKAKKYNNIFANSIGVDFSTIDNNYNSIIGLTGKAYFDCNCYLDCYAEKTYRNLAIYFIY